MSCFYYSASFFSSLTLLVLLSALCHSSSHPSVYFNLCFFYCFMLALILSSWPDFCLCCNYIYLYPPRLIISSTLCFYLSPGAVKRSTVSYTGSGLSVCGVWTLRPTKLTRNLKRKETWRSKKMWGLGKFSHDHGRYLDFFWLSKVLRWSNMLSSIRLFVVK